MVKRYVVKKLYAKTITTLYNEGSIISVGLSDLHVISILDWFILKFHLIIFFKEERINYLITSLWKHLFAYNQKLNNNSLIFHWNDKFDFLY